MPSQEAIIAANGGSLHEHRKATRKMRWWYEALADYMMANPNATQNEIAAHFKRATSTISTIINTDAFKAYMSQRRREHVSVLDASVRDKMLKVADKSMELILEQLEVKRTSIPIDTLQRTVDSTLKSLGYGVAAPGVNVNVNSGGGNTLVAVAVGVDDLERARTALRQSQQNAALGPRRESSTASPPLVDGEFTEVPE